MSLGFEKGLHFDFPIPVSGIVSIYCNMFCNMSEGNHFNFLVKAGVIVGSGGLIFGYDIGVIAGTLSQLQSRSYPDVLMKFMHQRKVNLGSC